MSDQLVAVWTPLVRRKFTRLGLWEIGRGVEDTEVYQQIDGCSEELSILKVVLEPGILFSELTCSESNLIRAVCGGVFTGATL